MKCFATIERSVSGLMQILSEKKVLSHASDLHFSLVNPGNVSFFKTILQWGMVSECKRGEVLEPA